MQAKAELGLENYTLSQTTLEQVFLNIASEQEGEEGTANGAGESAAAAAPASATAVPEAASFHA